jgi:hypothetical protein
MPNVGIEPPKVGSNDGLGPIFPKREELNMDDLKHLREVLTEAYPREELSLDALARVVVALEGLPSAALDGGWTFKGFTAWAQRLEGERAVLVRLLVQCDGVLSTMEGESTDEQERLDALRRAIMAATLPHRPEEADLLSLRACIGA